ncbi:PREDICTED: hyaluronidase PH-20 [Miniopterus natalensis]|uniref:hyaluronidase PH-20 n=1 Tax=Miniopterus natalensis TaxID=291302 RepID=UPI0007A6E43D|nr:PREDICTED: hyaluronidase PH-20 [Miniopterus natalensis]
MGVLEFKHIFFRSFFGSNGASQVLFTFLLIPCCLTKDFRAHPFLPNISFLWAWNAPTQPCFKRFNVLIDLSLFSLIGNPQKGAKEQPITLFYVDRLGLYPHIDKHGKSHNGGIPQLGNLTKHLEKAKKDIAFYMPTDKPGLAVIDWEEWRPIWARNWKPKDIYRTKSVDLVKLQHPQISDKDANDLAKENYEKEGRNFMQETLILGKSFRPGSLWGYYLFPDCYNHQYSKPDYSGHCFEIEKRRNNELNWLWNESTALFPSIYLNTNLMSSPKTALFVRNRVQEAIRVSTVRSVESPLPIFLYARPVFTDESSKYLTEEDLVSTLGETVSLGASGIIIWGSLNLSQSLVACTNLQSYMNSTLGPYIINVTLASKICSQVFCQDKGLCTRKEWNSSTYLHLNPVNFAIEIGENGKFKVKGKPSVEDLKHFAKEFHCSCYANSNCEKEVDLRKKLNVDVCVIEDVCVTTVLNSENEIFHSNLPLMLFHGRQVKSPGTKEWTIHPAKPQTQCYDSGRCELSGGRLTFLVALEKASQGSNKITLDL